MKILDFPELLQTYEYDCGATALQAVLDYHKIEIKENIIMQYAKTNSKIGTKVKGMDKVLDKFKLKYESKKMSVEEIEKYIDKKIPVILLLQAWGNNSENYERDFHDNHWVVAIGYDDNKIIFEDPYSFKRTFLTKKELLERWHARMEGELILNHGIAVYGKIQNPNEKKPIHMS